MGQGDLLQVTATWKKEVNAGASYQPAEGLEGTRSLIIVPFLLNPELSPWGPAPQDFVPVSLGKNPWPNQEQQVHQLVESFSEVFLMHPGRHT